MSTGLAADALVGKHDPGPDHPEQVARFETVFDRVSRLPLIRLPSRSANIDELALAHTRPYLDLVERETAQGRNQLSTGDTAISRDSGSAAKLAAGNVLSAVDAVLQREVANAFCVVRPPGHHASAARGMGFCLYNSVAVAARYAMRNHGVERVLIVDWDVHHGNGTQDIFYEDPSVLFFSTHQSPWYPGTGARNETGVGTTMNCPLPAYSGMEEIGAAFREQLLPAAAKFKADLVFISAGFDSRIDDPLGQFRLTDTDFQELTRMMLDIGDGRLVSVLEGGYNLEGLASASEAHVQALLGYS